MERIKGGGNMPKKLTYEEVKNYIELQGYQLLSEKYINNHTKLKMICDKGHDDIVINDKIKNKYAKKHSWKLIRIPYWEFDNIETILNKELKIINK